MVVTIEDLNKFLKQVKKARQEIKYNRKNFWNKNKVNFNNNIKTLISCFKFPENWTVSTIASRFLLDKFTMPYDKDVWSFSDVIGATKDQGFDIVLFFNKTDLEFLSLPSLLPIVVHEVAHVYQAAHDTNKYVTSAINDELSKKYETEADAEAKKYSDEFRKENVLEKVMFCYDEQSWKGARKMMDYLYLEAKDAFGGGYDQEVTEDEYKVFKKAEEEKDIDLFIDYFIESFDKKPGFGSVFLTKLKQMFSKKKKEGFLEGKNQKELDSFKP
jgi:hypothetical protein